MHNNKIPLAERIQTHRTGKDDLPIALWLEDVAFLDIVIRILGIDAQYSAMYQDMVQPYREMGCALQYVGDLMDGAELLEAAEQDSILFTLLVAPFAMIAKEESERMDQ